MGARLVDRSLALLAGLALGCVLAVAAPTARAFADAATLDGLAPIDSEALADLSYERARLAARWLAQSLRSNGKFNYVYDPDRDRYENGQYNPVRHAGVTYALFQAYEAFGDDAVGSAAEKAARFIVDSSPVVEDGRRAFVFAERTKLGAQALALVALLERRGVTGDTSYDGPIRELAEFLLSMEIPDEPGRYYQSFGAEIGDRRLTPYSDYYPGEALLALVRLADQFPDGPYFEYAARAARYLVHERDGDLPARGAVPGEDHWLTIALAELYQQHPEPAYAHVVYLQAESMLRHQFTPADNDVWAIGASRLRNPVNFTSTATKAEALIAAWELAARRGDAEMAARAADGARRTVQFLMRVQHTEENTGQFPRPDRLIGAWGQDAVKPYVRMDFVQHNVSALLGVWRLTELTGAATGHGAGSVANR